MTVLYSGVVYNTDVTSRGRASIEVSHRVSDTTS